VSERHYGNGTPVTHRELRAEIRTLDVKFERVDDRFGHVDEQFDEVKVQLEAIQSHVGAAPRWMGARANALIDKALPAVLIAGAIIVGGRIF
jgi:hypothetical protein